MQFCTPNLNHIYKQVLKTHLQTTQQVYCCFGFHEQRMSCLQGINKYMTSRAPVVLTAVMGSIESYRGHHCHCQGRGELNPS